MNSGMESYEEAAARIERMYQRNEARLDVGVVERAALDAVRRYLATTDVLGAEVRVRHAMAGLSVAECAALHGVFLALAELTQGPGR